MEKKEMFRDTTNLYLDIEKYASPRLIKFAADNAGKEILDVGCATGDYCSNLGDLGFKCTGIDINPEYIEKACQKSIDAYMMKAEDLKFPDNSFDTVLLFEVLEHVDDPQMVLKESKRVARKNILITVPNCTHFNELRALGLTYEHVLEKDHVNFFTKNDLEDLISKEFKNFKVEEEEPTDLNQLLQFTGSSRLLNILISSFNKIKKVKPFLYYRLYTVIEI